MKILISGGHLTPALAFIDYIQKQTTDRVVFVGRLYSQDLAKQRSQEQAEVTQRQIPFIPFDSAVRIRKHESWVAKLLRPIRFLQSVRQALSIMSAEKPDVFLTFGGYLAMPLAVAAKLRGIPTVTHEQTRTAGFANQCIGFLADRIALSFTDSQQYFPNHKTTVTGNPIRQEILQRSTQQPVWIDKKLTKPLLLITCGNQGSHAINFAVGQVLKELTTDWVVIHLVGNPTAEVDYVSEFTLLKQHLPPDHRHNYFVRTWTNGTDLAWLYTNATAAVARSGANTVQELVTRQIPTLFIPLPFSHRNEQLLNAEALTKVGAALVLPQSELTPQSLLTNIQQLRERHNEIKKNLINHTMPLDGDRRLYELVHSVAHEK